MQADSPVGMVPMIRNILGGFLFAGDDIYKRAGVLSGGERTRLAVARMLLRPANTLLLDEPTNHLDLDSKDVLLEALEDFGGTLIFVSHDRYFVDRLATKIIAVGHGAIEVYPGTYEQFLWSRAQRAAAAVPAAARNASAAAERAPGWNDRTPGAPHARRTGRAHRPDGREAADPHGDTRRSRRRPMKRRSGTMPTPVGGDGAADDRQRRVSRARRPDRRARAGDQGPRGQMAAAGFLRRPRVGRSRDRPRHQTLMWEVGDLMNQWETLQRSESSE